MKPDIRLPGPFPRKLTGVEIAWLRAMMHCRVNDIVNDAENMNFCLGDSLTVSYTAFFGTQKEVVEAKQLICGAVPPDGGPPCKLDLGHNCQHSSVKRW